MPEGPTLHRLARDHTELLGGQKLAVSSPQGRFAESAKLLDGKKLVKAEAWGKHLFYDFAGGRVLHVHLGLYGKYRRYDHTAKEGPPEPRGAVRVRLSGKTATLDLNGPNQCHVIDDAERDAILARLGPDPLRPDADPDKAWQRIHASRQPVGQLLMDQSVIAGLGNIYRAEVLWKLGLHPRTPGKAVTKKQFDTIWKDSVRWMKLAVETGHIYTTDRYTPATAPKRPTKKQRFMIYKLPTCPTCGADIEAFTMAGRTVYACSACQSVQGESSRVRSEE